MEHSDLIKKFSAETPMEMELTESRKISWNTDIKEYESIKCESWGISKEDLEKREEEIKKAIHTYQEDVQLEIYVVLMDMLKEAKARGAFNAPYNVEFQFWENDVKEIIEYANEKIERVYIEPILDLARDEINS